MAEKNDDDLLGRWERKIKNATQEPRRHNVSVHIDELRDAIDQIEGLEVEKGVVEASAALRLKAGLEWKGRFEAAEAKFADWERRQPVTHVKLVDECRELEAKLSEYEAVGDALIEVNAELKAKLANSVSRSRLDAMEVELAERDSEIERLRDLLRESLETGTQLEAKLAERDAEIGALERTASEDRRAVNCAVDRDRTCTDLNPCWTHELAVKVKRIAELEDRLDEAYPRDEF